MMPYIMTRKRLTPDGLGVTRPNERRAVATLDGREVWNALYGVEIKGREEVVERIAALPEAGGTVTLPDGTVIEVARRATKDIAAELLMANDYHFGEATEDEIVAAFNAKQAA